MRASRLVVVSNRLPLSLEWTEAGWRTHASSGGLATALDHALERTGGLWVGWPGVSSDELPEASPALAAAPDRSYRLLPVPVSKQEHELFYLGFSNEVLWPLFHDLQGRCVFAPEYERAYLAVNRRFAEITARALRAGDVVWVHDYHLIPAGSFLRELTHGDLAPRLGFFLHIPFPPPDIFAKLPHREALLRQLVAYDLVGFQTVRDRRNFAACLRALLPEARVLGRGNRQRVMLRDHVAKLGSFPIGIDARAFATAARRPDVAARAAQLRREVGGTSILLGVDRLDYTKGIPFKLEAVHRLLLARQELRGRLTLIQIVVPSRSEIPEYRRQRDEVEGLVGRINGELGEPGWTPIHYLYRSLDRDELVAYYRAADVCLATPLKDGMNLVAKEYCACQVELDGAIVLSEFAGAAVDLADGAILVNPYDILETADGIAAALDLTADERRLRMSRLRRAVSTGNIGQWVNDFLGELETPLSPDSAMQG
jgi:trehalose 6-phosphate synthase